jgi:hypothetical protein
VQACYEAVVQDPECSKDYFTYNTRSDQNCGCKKHGALNIRDDADADYYRIQLVFISLRKESKNENWL